MYLLYNMGRYGIGVDDEKKLLEIDSSKTPLAYPEAAELAARSAESDSESFRLRLPFRPNGKRIGETGEDSYPRDIQGERGGKAAPERPERPLN